jgi:hypothetical protein
MWGDNQFLITSQLLRSWNLLVNPRLYRWIIISAWLFVLAITAYDIRWAIRYRETIAYWESNPIQRWVIAQFGVWVATSARLSGIIVAGCLMFLATRRAQVAATTTLFSVHAYLGATYAIIVWDPSTLVR